MPHYIVRNSETGEERLVRADNQAQALRHVARTTYSVEAATVDQAVALLTTEPPHQVEIAGVDPEPARVEPPCPDLLSAHAARGGSVALEAA